MRKNNGNIIGNTNDIVNNCSYSFKAFKIDNYWGYDIYKNNQLLIHQPNIPAIQGNVGFLSEKDAITIAKLTIMKLQKGIMPPAISIVELDSLRVTN